MLRAKLAGRVNYPGSFHLNGWMSSALARRTWHQFREEGEANRKFWTGGARHCFELILYKAALPLLSSLHLCLCWRAASKPSPVCLFLLFPPSTGIQPSGCLLAALPWLVAQGTPFQSLPQPPLCSTELWHCPVLTEMRALGWAFAAQVKPPRATGERSEPISFSKFQFKSHLCNLWDRSVKGSVGVPWHEGQPLFYFQQLLWKQLVLHELFAFQS